MMFSNAALASMVMSSLAVVSVNGHGYLEVPMSRNRYQFYNGLEPSWQSPTEGKVMKDYNSESVNGNTGVCGHTQNIDAMQIDYTKWEDSTGKPMPWNSVATYAKGSIIEAQVHLTAEHCGFFEFKACPITDEMNGGRSATQECFDNYKLEFIEDITEGHIKMPKDPAYPDRAYFAYGATSKDLKYKLKLPDNLAGEKVLLQWMYWTGNSCWLDGYDQYITEVSNQPVHNYCLNVAQCPPRETIPMYRHPNFANSQVPEVFWNCAEITITGEAEPTPPFPAPTPVSQPEPTPVSSPTAPLPTPTSGGGGGEVPCGNGMQGNGICADPSLCCSEYFYCGTSEAHCGSSGGGGGGTPPGPTPVSQPVALPPFAPTEHGGTANERMIAYVGNWFACPTDEQMAQYTHVVIGFAVSYTWAPDKNKCSETCEIYEPAVCNNQNRPDLIEHWKSMGKEVILSFGGAGMGGSWDGHNDCWEYCFGRETQVVDQLVEMVNSNGYTGIDIDYEYFHEDSWHFTRGAEAQKFLKDITLQLRSKLPAGSEITHAPMEPDVVPGRGYFDVLVEIGDALDFLMPQYYNGYVYSHSNFPGALAHYTDIVDNIFHGDASKVVYGFCIKDCTSFNLDGAKSAEVMAKLTEAYPCNGGAFFWVSNDDTNAGWSKTVNGQLSLNAGACDNPSHPEPTPVDPTATPVVDPTATPVVDPTATPVADPTATPVADPTATPVADPTASPVTPTAAPVSSGGGEGCCSYDFKTCASWGNENGKEGCEALGGMKWLENGALTGDAAMCIAKDSACKDNLQGCCDGLTCDGDEWWKACKYLPNNSRRGVRAF